MTVFFVLLKITFGILALLFMVAGFLSIVRSTHVSTVLSTGNKGGPSKVSDPDFLRDIALYTGTRFSVRNRVEVLLNGDETNPRLWGDLRGAQKSILIQSYYSEPSQMLDRLVDILCDRAENGVTIAVLFDAFGSGAVRKSPAVARMKAAGIYVEYFRPLKWYAISRSTFRSHARGILIDGRIGYTGGFGIADLWDGDGRTDGGWRETNVRFEGPAVESLQAAFAAEWAEATGVLITGEGFFPHIPDASEAPDSPNSVDVSLAGFMHTVPTSGSTAAERFLALTIAGASETLYITNSYSVPGPDFRAFLVDAARRGVDVRLLTTGKKTDVKTTSIAGKAFYEELLEGGVRIYEYQPTMMHAKTLVVDGMWVSIGSMNLDNRSLALNNETSLLVLDPPLGQKMNEIFLADLEFAREIILSEFKQRPWHDRILEWGAERLWRIL